MTVLLRLSKLLGHSLVVSVSVDRYLLSLSAVHSAHAARGTARRRRRRTHAHRMCLRIDLYKVHQLIIRFYNKYKFI